MVGKGRYSSNAWRRHVDSGVTTIDLQAVEVMDNDRSEHEKNGIIQTENHFIPVCARAGDELRD
jgi:hypothetical protein